MKAMPHLGHSKIVMKFGSTEPLPSEVVILAKSR
jgi:hypothetical protein